MGIVDVGNDNIRRLVVRHCRYDPQRRERRHVVVAAFDNEAAFHALIDSIDADIRRHRAEGEPVGRNEHASGIVYEPGDRKRTATGHLMRSMLEHGVDPRSWSEAQELPPNIAQLGPE